MDPDLEAGRLCGCRSLLCQAVAWWWICGFVGSVGLEQCAMVVFIVCFLLLQAWQALRHRPLGGSVLRFGRLAFCDSAVCAGCRWYTGLVGDKMSGFSSTCSAAGEVVDSVWLHHFTIVILCGSQAAVALVPLFHSALAPSGLTSATSQSTPITSSRRMPETSWS